MCYYEIYKFVNGQVIIIIEDIVYYERNINVPLLYSQLKNSTKDTTMNLHSIFHIVIIVIRPDMIIHGCNFST